MSVGKRGLLRLVTVVTLLVVFYYGVLFTGQLPYHWRVDGYNDLILHTGAFGLLTLLAVPATGRPWETVLALAAFAVAIELWQMSMPTRNASLKDIVAGISGIGLALFALALLARLRISIGSRSQNTEVIAETDRRPG